MPAVAMLTCSLFQFYSHLSTYPLTPYSPSIIITFFLCYSFIGRMSVAVTCKIFFIKNFTVVGNSFKSNSQSRVQTQYLLVRYQLLIPKLQRKSEESCKEADCKFDMIKDNSEVNLYAYSIFISNSAKHGGALALNTISLFSALTYSCTNNTGWLDNNIKEAALKFHQYHSSNFSGINNVNHKLQFY